MSLCVHQKKTKSVIYELSDNRRQTIMIPIISFQPSVFSKWTKFVYIKLKVLLQNSTQFSYSLKSPVITSLKVSTSILKARISIKVYQYRFTKLLEKYHSLSSHPCIIAQVLFSYYSWLLSCHCGYLIPQTQFMILPGSPSFWDIPAILQSLWIPGNLIRQQKSENTGSAPPHIYN